MRNRISMSLVESGVLLLALTALGPAVRAQAADPFALSPVAVENGIDSYIPYIYPDPDPGGILLVECTSWQNCFEDSWPITAGTGIGPPTTWSYTLTASDLASLGSTAALIDADNTAGLNWSYWPDTVSETTLTITNGNGTVVETIPAFNTVVGISPNPFWAGTFIIPPCPTSATISGSIGLSGSFDIGPGTGIDAQALYLQPIGAVAAPTITSISPDTWIAGSVYSVTIAGTNFIPNSGPTAGCAATPVSISTPSETVIALSNVTVVSATQITATVAPPAREPSETATVTVGTAPNTASATAQIMGDINGTCLAALATAHKNQAAITRAENAWSVLQAAADAHDIDPALLAAIAVRETGFMNVPERLPNGKEGPGMGVFQLTNQPGVTPAQAGDLTFAANYAANILSSNESYLSNKFPAFTPDQLLQATAASYNIGPYPPHGISGNPNTIDVGTAPGGIHGNYGSNVVGLMSCFADQ